MPRVLIIDDDDTLRRLMKVSLQTLNCEIFEAPNGIAGEELAQEINPDLILIDIMMPLQDGYKTCANLRAFGYEGMILMCSSLQERREKVRTQSSGANGFIQKPFTRDAIQPYLGRLQ